MWKKKGKKNKGKQQLDKSRKIKQSNGHKKGKEIGVYCKRLCS